MSSNSYLETSYLNDQMFRIVTSQKFKHGSVTCELKSPCEQKVFIFLTIKVLPGCSKSVKVL